MGCFGSKDKLSKEDMDFLKTHTRYDESTIKEWYKGFKVWAVLFSSLQSHSGLYSYTGEMFARADLYIDLVPNSPAFVFFTMCDMLDCVNGKEIGTAGCVVVFDTLPVGI